MIKLFNFSVFIVTLIACQSSNLSPERFWPAGFASLCIPVLLAVNVCLLAYYLLKGKLWFVLPLLTLLFGYQHVRATVAFNNTKPITPKAFSLLSYNVRVFNSYAHLHKDEGENPMLAWSKAHTAEVKCFQEYYNEESSALYNATAQLSENGYHSYVQPYLTNRDGVEFGLAVFSKFPIVSKGELHLHNNRHHYGIYADLLVEHDTVRIYNVHLQSMSIDENKIGQLSNAKENHKKIAHKLRHGFVTRSMQVDSLLQHIQQCPHRLILTGDFNDMPYSYTYTTLRNQLSNAFEESGQGLGFSYNGRLFFLRIDNQFYTQGLQSSQFTTYRDVPYSDHFPISADYTFEK